MSGEGKLKIDVELSSVFEGAGLSRHLSVEMEDQEATVKGLLHRISEIGGDKINPFLFEKGGESVLPGLMVMVNDRVLTGTALSQQGVELKDGDKVSLLYFISGG
jgi:hypothetical protein